MGRKCNHKHLYKREAEVDLRREEKALSPWEQRMEMCSHKPKYAGSPRRSKEQSFWRENGLLQ